MTPVKMLTAAEGEFSLSAGVVYNLPEPLASSLLEAGLATEPDAGDPPALDVAGNVPAPHHTNGYREFLEPGQEPTEDGEPKPRTRRPKT